MPFLFLIFAGVLQQTYRGKFPYRKFPTSLTGVLIKRRKHKKDVPSEERPQEGTVGRWPSASLQSSQHVNTYFWTSVFQTWEEINFSCLSYPVCGVL
jgi:hypothetical protein